MTDKEIQGSVKGTVGEHLKDSECITRSVKHIIDDIRNIPSVKPLENQPQWIPVSERLPEDNTLVLVTVKVGNREPKVRSGNYYMDGHFYIDNGDCWESRDKELLAWMPLPPSYQGEENG